MSMAYLLYSIGMVYLSSSKEEYPLVEKPYLWLKNLETLLIIAAYYLTKTIPKGI